MPNDGKASAAAGPVRLKGYLATVDHAIRLKLKADNLTSEYRRAMAVAADLVGDVPTEVLSESLTRLRSVNVVGRGKIEAELRRRPCAEFAVPVGTVVRRRNGDSTPWPTAPAWVYVLYGYWNDQPDVILYVGLTQRIKQRLTKHRSKFRWLYADLIACPSRQQAFELEGDLIYQYQPPGNVADIGERRYRKVDIHDLSGRWSAP